ncbi:hypothetical protein GUJ93_ZPchr0008g13895 [Zizania palustris]|uniref:Uncharacterized protein n=1 Tax=Zizania palustris TaxID=103762 RepID=A0A8J5RXB2_ZIZPA|nr:hypothetical protein GUJ93_ZPchr0008g13895 [Zizania palustris]
MRPTLFSMAPQPPPPPPVEEILSFSQNLLPSINPIMANPDVIAAPTTNIVVFVGVADQQGTMMSSWRSRSRGQETTRRHTERRGSSCIWRRSAFGEEESKAVMCATKQDIDVSLKI